MSVSESTNKDIVNVKVSQGGFDKRLHVGCGIFVVSLMTANLTTLLYNNSSVLTVQFLLNTFISPSSLQVKTGAQ